MGISNSRIEIITDPSMNDSATNDLCTIVPGATVCDLRPGAKIPLKKIELKRIKKTHELHYNTNNNILYSGELHNTDRFIYVVINDKLQCIIPENIIKYSDVNIMTNALESLNIECRDKEGKFTYNEYKKLRIVQKLSDRIKMLSDHNSNINIFEHFTI